MMHKAWCSIEKVPYYFSGSSIKFQGHTGWKINNFNPIWVRLLGLRFALFKAHFSAILNHWIIMSYPISVESWSSFSKHYMYYKKQSKLWLPTLVLYQTAYRKIRDFLETHTFAPEVIPLVPILSAISDNIFYDIHCVSWQKPSWLKWNNIFHIFQIIFIII